MNAKRKGIVMPIFVIEQIQVEKMHRDELEAEFSKITPDTIDQLDENSKFEIKLAQEKIA